MALGRIRALSRKLEGLILTCFRSEKLRSCNATTFITCEVNFTAQPPSRIFLDESLDREELKRLKATMSISENDWGAQMLNLWLLNTFLPCNDIGLMLKYDIIGGPRAIPKVYKLTPKVERSAKEGMRKSG